MKNLLLAIILILAVQAIGLSAQPVAADAEFHIGLNTPARGDLKALITEGNPPYTFEVQDLATNGTVILNPSGSFSFTLNPGLKSGSFSYTAREADGNSDSATVTIIAQ